MENFWRGIAFDLFLGVSSTCRNCKKEFSANSDGCPNCGSYITARINDFSNKPEEGEVLGELKFDEKTGYYKAT